MIALRPYQVEAIEKVRDSYRRGHRAPCLVLPTGGGKTIIAAEIIRSAVALGNRVLFLAHRVELIEQSVAKLSMSGLHAIRMIRASQDLGVSTDPVTVASVQTLTTKGWMDRLPKADLVVFDEAHHTIAKTWKRIADAYAGARVLGMTATPQRADGAALGDIFDDLVVGATVKQLTALGHLVPCIVMRPPDRLGTGELAQTPAEAYVRHGRDERAVVFCTTVERAQVVAAEMPVASDVVHGGMSMADRAAVLARFKAGVTRCVVNVFVLTEGWDDPGCSVCILERNPAHAGNYLQMIGRVLRPAPGKTQATLIDLCGSSWTHGMPDWDRRYSLDGKGIEKPEREPVVQCPACGAAFSPGPDCCPQCGAALPRRAATDPTVLGIPLEDAAKQPPRPMPIISMASKFPGRCRACKQPIAVGDRIHWTQGQKAKHAVCGQADGLEAANALLRAAQ